MLGFRETTARAFMARLEGFRFRFAVGPEFRNFVFPLRTFLGPFSILAASRCLFACAFAWYGREQYSASVLGRKKISLQRGQRDRRREDPRHALVGVYSKFFLQARG